MWELKLYFRWNIESQKHIIEPVKVFLFFCAFVIRKIRFHIRLFIDKDKMPENLSTLVNID